jgi:hypothetical protein
VPIALMRPAVTATAPGRERDMPAVKIAPPLMMRSGAMSPGLSYLRTVIVKVSWTGLPSAALR